MRCLLVGLFVSLFVLASSAWAGHHSWNINEVFSDDDTTIQFVEMHCPVSGENGLDTWTVKSDSTAITFTFDADVVGSTLNRSALIGTNAYAALTGAPAPDYVLPDSFFDVSGDTLRYAGSSDVWTFGAVPTNGTDSLDRIGGVGLNSPKNLNGDEGSVDANPPPPEPVPSFAAWGLAVLAGFMLLGASGLLRRDGSHGSAA
ncbi:MAG: hypothetical protein JRG90_19590 [Deltaproteobacteria bacterium]|nr:hypothetical protein [Deltaproteobacteria bacterium]